MKNLGFRIFLSFIGCFAVCGLDALELSAQEPKESQKNADSGVSYPGEMQSTEQGSKVRRWSTSGPVKVSPPPQPFDDPEKARIPKGTFINIDSSQNHNPSRRNYERK